MLKISFSTLACPDWTWHDVVKLGSQYGYDGVEIRLLQRETDLLNIADLRPHLWPQRQQDLKDSGFRVAGLASSVRFDANLESERAAQIEIGRRYIEMCVALGGEFIRVFGDVLPTEGDPARSGMIRQVADGLATLAETANAAGIQILLETHGDFSASPPCVEVMHHGWVCRALPVQVIGLRGGRDDGRDERIEALHFEFGEWVPVGQHVVRAAGFAGEPVDQVVALTHHAGRGGHAVVGDNDEVHGDFFRGEARRDRTDALIEELHRSDDLRRARAVAVDTG